LPSTWEATVNANGAVIPEGAAADYRGPCPGEFQRHRYRFTVTALDAGGHALASAQSIQIAVNASIYVQRSTEGIAQPPISAHAAAGRLLLSGRGSAGPSTPNDIGPYLGIAGWGAQRIYRESDDPVFGPGPSSPTGY